MKYVVCSFTHKYLGAFDYSNGVSLPTNCTEVSGPPDDITQIWDGSGWSASILPNADTFVAAIINDTEMPLEIAPYIEPLRDDTLREATWAAMERESPSWFTAAYKQQLIDWAAAANISLGE